jgi:hypothetical protein
MKLLHEPLFWSPDFPIAISPYLVVPRICIPDALDDHDVGRRVLGYVDID